MYITLSQQTLYFLYAIILGIIIGLLFDITRLLRNLFPNNKILIFIVDVVFCLVVAVLTFMFSLAYYSGVIRIYTLLGEVIGFIVFLLTIGELTKHLHKFLRIFFVKNVKILKNIIKKVLKHISDLLYNVKKKTVNQKKK